MTGSRRGPTIRCALVDVLAFLSQHDKKTRSYFLILVAGLLTLTLRKLILLKIAIPKSPEGVLSDKERWDDSDLDVAL